MTKERQVKHAQQDLGIGRWGRRAAVVVALAAFAPLPAWGRGRPGGGAGAVRGAYPRGQAGQNPNNPNNPSDPNNPNKNNPNSNTNTNPNNPAPDGTDPKGTGAKADPAAERKACAEKFEQALADGLGSRESLTALMEATATGSFPAGKPTRDALAAALGDSIAGKQVSKPQAKALGEAMAAAVNADGLPKDAGASRGQTVGRVLTEMKVPEPQRKAAVAAYAKVVGEQQHPEAAKFAHDLAQVKDGTDVTAQEKQTLANDVQAMCKGAAKPNKQVATQLGADLAKALSDKQLSPAQQAQVARDVDAIVNSGNASEEDVKAVFADLEGVAKAASVDDAKLQAVAGDLQTIYQSHPHPKAAAAAAR